MKRIGNQWRDENGGAFCYVRFELLIGFQEGDGENKKRARFQNEQLAVRELAAHAARHRSMCNSGS